MVCLFTKLEKRVTNQPSESWQFRMPLEVVDALVVIVDQIFCSLSGDLVRFLNCSAVNGTWP